MGWKDSFTFANMKAFLVQSNSASDMKLLMSVAPKMGIATKPLYNEDILDMGLLNAMEEGKKTPLISKEKVMKKLMRYADKIS